jgi:hypothetical protein
VKPYQSIKLTEQPDVADIKSEGRRSHVGKLKRGKRYCSGNSKWAARRRLKRLDKAVAEKDWKVALQH